MIIETTRLRLRPLTPEDGASVVAALNDWHVAQWLSVPPYPYGASDFADYLDIVRHDHAGPYPTRFAVELRQNNELIGSVAVDAHESGDGELGYWYGRAYWGLGYATEAAKAVVAHALACPAIRRLTAITDPANEASHHVLLKSGFRMTGLRERDPPSRRGARAVRLYEHGRPSASPG